MIKTQKNKAPDNIYGLNIYEDKKGRLIYYDILKKRAVFIPAFDFKQFSFYRYRYIIALSVFVVLQTLLTEFFSIHYLVPIGITLIIYFFLELKFRQFINDKQPVKHFDKKDCKGYFDILNTQDPQKMILKAVLYVLLGALLVFNAYDKNYQGFTLIFCWLILIVCIGVSALQLIAYFKRK